MSTKRITVLGTHTGWHFESLRAAFEKRNARVSYASADLLRTRTGFSGGALCPLADCDALMIRGMPAGSAEQIIYRMDALFTLERGGLPCINSPKTIEKTVDKYFTTALLREAGLPVPPTVCCEAEKDAILEALGELGGDMIYKPLFGSCGKGLVRVTGEAEADALAQSLAGSGSIAYLQKFIPCANSDLRLFVLDGRVIAAMRRIGAGWLANFSRGGRVEAYTPTALEEEMAVTAAKAVSAEVAGVDIIKGDDGSTYVIEVNGSPGWKGLSLVTDADVAGEIADYVLRRTC